MSHHLLFLKQFFRNPKEIGSFIPASKHLVEEIIKNINFRRAKTIIEIGMGTGAITKEIIRNCEIDAQIIGIEKNKQMFDYVNKYFQSNINPIFINDDVVNLNKYFVAEADYIISSLPFRNFSIRKQAKIMNIIKSNLKENGKLILYQYTNHLDRLLKSYFKSVKKSVVLRNMPVAIVYVCGDVL